jgi:hypothetical protein
MDVIVSSRQKVGAGAEKETKAVGCHFGKDVVFEVYVLPVVPACNLFSRQFDFYGNFLRFFNFCCGPCPDFAGSAFYGVPGGCRL